MRYFQMIGLTNITSRGKIQRFTITIIITNLENDIYLRKFFVEKVLARSTRLPRERTLHAQIYILHTDYVDYRDTPTETSYILIVHEFTCSLFGFFFFSVLLRRSKTFQTRHIVHRRVEIFLLIIIFLLL